MSVSIFLRQLLILSALTAFVLWGVNQLSALQPYQLFSWISLVFFIILTLAMFFTGLLTSKSKSKSAFTGTILGFTFAKIVLSLVIVVAYYQWAKPSSKAFVIPFFITYLVYTAFETWFMTQLGRQKR